VDARIKSAQDDLTWRCGWRSIPTRLSSAGSSAG
jgi:hypothetical protein